jgi:thiopeptide-type bacteriocin biosynthesis protein
VPDAVRRAFPPGSEWTYLRLYTGETLADRVLTDDIEPVVRALAEAASIDRWFFLRYRDPAFHLRVRFHGAPGSRVGSGSAAAAAEAVGADLIERGRAWRVELGTYEREVERYGGPEAIELVERVFDADSNAVLALLGRLEPGDEGQQERWRIGLVGAHRLLVDLGLDASERAAIVSAVRASRARELRWGHAERVKLGERYRIERRLLARLLDPADRDPTGYESGLEVLDDRSRAVEPIGKDLRGLERAGRLTVPLTEIAGSLLHMHLNRMLRGDNIAQEAVVADLLARLYESATRRQAARPGG